MGLYDNFSAGTLGATFGVLTEAWAKKMRFEPWTRRPYMYPAMALVWGFFFAETSKYFTLFREQTVHQYAVRDRQARQYYGERLARPAEPRRARASVVRVARCPARPASRAKRSFLPPRCVTLDSARRGGQEGRAERPGRGIGRVGGWAGWVCVPFRRGAPSARLAMHLSCVSTHYVPQMTRSKGGASQAAWCGKAPRVLPL